MYGHLKAIPSEGVPTAATSRAMRRIRSAGNRTTEVRVRLALVRAGVRGWVVRPDWILGHPDFFIPETNTAIFVDGCFWHGCRKCCPLPKSNARFWACKLRINRRRDRTVNRLLAKQGISVVRIWEHEVSKAIADGIEKLIGK
jgi:DNA mismatch endonuclease, patch repair protein